MTLNQVLIEGMTLCIQAQFENVSSLGQIALFVSLVYPQRLEHLLSPSRYLEHVYWFIELTSF